MAKVVHFVVGMPRAGASLLCDVLAQNPRFHAAAAGGILDAILIMRKSWNEIVEFNGLNNTHDKMNVLRAMFEGYFADSSCSVVFETSRAWLAHLELAEALVQRKAKVLVCVRDLREILASFEKHWRRSRAAGPTVHERQFYREFQTVEGRCEVLMREDQVVGLAYNRIRDALLRGFRDRMHFVSFEQLTAAPAQTLDGIYEFLGEELFSHNFDNIKPVPLEHWSILGTAARIWKGTYVWDPYLSSCEL